MDNISREREERIQKYTERASKEEPLFQEGMLCNHKRFIESTYILHINRRHVNREINDYDASYTE